MPCAAGAGLAPASSGLMVDGLARLALMSDLLETIPAPVLASDEAGRIVFVNADAREIGRLAATLDRPADEALPDELRSIWAAGDDGIYHWVELGESCYYAACRNLPGGWGGRLLMLVPQGSPWHAMLHDPQ